MQRFYRSALLLNHRIVGDRRADRCRRRNSNYRCRLWLRPPPKVTGNSGRIVTTLQLRALCSEPPWWNVLIQFYVLAIAT